MTLDRKPTDNCLTRFDTKFKIEYIHYQQARNKH